MADYRKIPDARPWARQLFVGDKLTVDQARCVDHTRLRDFGLELDGRGAYRVVVNAASAA